MTDQQQTLVTDQQQTLHVVTTRPYRKKKNPQKRGAFLIRLYVSCLRLQQQEALKKNLSRWVRECLKDYATFEDLQQKAGGVILTCMGMPDEPRNRLCAEQLNEINYEGPVGTRKSYFETRETDVKNWYTAACINSVSYGCP